MIRIAICDDDPLFMDMIQVKTNDYFLTTEQEFELSCYSSGKPLLFSDKEETQRLTFDCFGHIP